MSETLATSSSSKIMDIGAPGPGLTDIKKLSASDSGDGDAQEQLLDFTFEYRGFLFAAKVQTGEDGCDTLHFHANLGRVPYSAESPYFRMNAMAIVAAASKCLSGRIKITDQQRILLYYQDSIAGRLTPVSLMAEVVRVLVQAKPFLELLSICVELPTQEKTAFSKPKQSGLGRVRTPGR